MLMLLLRMQPHQIVTIYHNDMQNIQFAIHICSRYDIHSNINDARRFCAPVSLRLRLITFIFHRLRLVAATCAYAEAACFAGDAFFSGDFRLLETFTFARNVRSHQIAAVITATLAIDFQFICLNGEIP